MCGNVYDQSYTRNGDGPECPVCNLVWRVEQLEQEVEVQTEPEPSTG